MIFFKWSNLVGYDGITNYVHMLGAAHMKYYLRKWHNLKIDCKIKAGIVQQTISRILTSLDPNGWPWIKQIKNPSNWSMELSDDSNEFTDYDQSIYIVFLEKNI